LEKQVGLLTKDMAADLVILSDNPMDDIRNIAKIETVIKNGHVLDRSRLNKLIIAPSKIRN